MIGGPCFAPKHRPMPTVLSTAQAKIQLDRRKQLNLEHCLYIQHCIYVKLYTSTFKTCPIRLMFIGSEKKEYALLISSTHNNDWLAECLTCTRTIQPCSISHCSMHTVLCSTINISFVNKHQLASLQNT